jgi:hypothetical protein
MSLTWWKVLTANNEDQSVGGGIVNTTNALGIGLTPQSKYWRKYSARKEGHWDWAD